MKVRPVRPSFMQGIGLVVHPVNCGVEDQEWELEGEQEIRILCGEFRGQLTPAEFLIRQPHRKLHFQNGM